MPGNQAINCFVDTNIWLYAFIEADDTDKSERARTLIQASEPVVSLQVINENFSPSGLNLKWLGNWCASIVLHNR